MALRKSLLAVMGIVALIGMNASATEFIIKFKTQKQFSNSYMSLRDFDGLNFAKDGFHQTGKIAKIELLARNETELQKKLDLLKKRTDIEYIVPNIKFYATPISNDPKGADQWALEKINAAGAWIHTEGSAKVVVAVIDTGVDYNHEDLKANMWVNSKEIPDNGKDDDGNGFVDDVRGWNFRDNNNDPMDKTGDANPGHGTHCAGIIGAVGNNNIGISGISQKVSIMPVKFLGADGSGDLFSSTKAIDYAIANGANIISASWGAAVPKSTAQPIVDAIDRARQKGVIFVVAAANDGTNNDSRSIFPANAELSNVISVAATDVEDKKPKWSNYGMKTVHVGAPGHEILSTIPNNEYKKLSGTSMATPLVAGLVALLQSLDPTLDGPSAKAVLQTSGAAMDLEVACKCRIDAGKAADIVAQKKLTLVPSAVTLATGEKAKLGAYAGVGPFTFQSSNPEIAKVTTESELEAVKEGEVTVTVTDSTGATAQSRLFRVSDAKPAAGGECPIPDPQICALMCLIMPDAPWCDGKSETPELPEIPGVPKPGEILGLN